eukprot:scaffold84_cov388-Prasinococcus_capsulatus_cf.AAC.14
MDGWYDACLGWLDTPNRRLSFGIGDPMIEVPNAALVMRTSKAEELGLENARRSNLEDLVVGVVAGYATSASALRGVLNPLTQQPFQPSEIIHYSRPSQLLLSLHSGNVDVAFVFTDLVPFVPLLYTFLHDAIDDYASGGTTILAPKGHEFLDIWNAALPAVMANESYWNLCVEYGVEDRCLNGTRQGTSPSVESHEKVYKLAVGLEFEPYDFIDFDEANATDPLPVSGFAIDLAREVCMEAGVRCEIVFDSYDECMGRFFPVQPRLHGGARVIVPVEGSRSLSLTGFANGDQVPLPDSTEIDIEYAGNGIQSEWYDACVGWVATPLRQASVKFGQAMTSVPAGALLMLRTTIAQLGGEDAVRQSNLEGLRVGYMEGFALNGQSLSTVRNPTTAVQFRGFSAHPYPRLGLLVSALVDGEIDVVWVLEETLTRRRRGGSFLEYPRSELFTLLFGGLTDYAESGLSVFSARGNEFIDIWNSALPAVVASPVYEQLCEQYSVNECLSLPGTPTASNSTGEKVYRLAVGLNFPPFDFVGVPTADSPVPIAGFGYELAMMVCEEAGVQCEPVLDPYDASWGRYIVTDTGLKVARTAIRSGEWEVSQLQQRGFLPPENAIAIEYAGEGLLDGWYDGALNWVPTKLRQLSLGFGDPIANIRGAGLLMTNGRISRSGGLEAVRQASNLTGWTIGFVPGYAMNPLALSQSLNPVTGEAFFGYTIARLPPNPAFATVQLLAGDVDAVFFFDDLFDVFADSPVLQPPLGAAAMTFVHTGMTEYATNGPTVMTAKGSPFLEIWNAGLTRIIPSPAYEALCNKYRVESCIDVELAPVTEPPEDSTPGPEPSQAPGPASTSGSGVIKPLIACLGALLAVL